MAEYAGLEIRIGGDTTKLNSALKASTKSAAELQSRIRQATRAMKFDPTDLKNVDTRIKLTGDRMQSLQSKAQLVGKAMQQLGDSMSHVLDGRGEPKTIKQLADETDNLSLAAKQADEHYNQLTGSLASVYEAWNKMVRGEGEEFAKSLDISPEQAEHLMSASTSIKELNDAVERINRNRTEGLDFAAVITPEQLATLTKFKELNFHDMFGQGIGLDEAIQQAKDLGVTIKDDAIENVRELQRTFKEAAERKEDFDKALQYEQAGTDLQRINSEAESLSQTMRWLDDSMTETSKTPWFQSLEQDIRKVDAALDNVEADLKRTEEAMKVDPNNIELAVRYMKDLQQKADLSEEKMSLLKNEMAHLDASGAKEAAESHEDLAKWVEESAENARVANKELNEQKATVKNLEQAIDDVTRSLSTVKRDSTVTEYSKNVLDWQRNTKRLSEAMDDLKTKEELVASTQRKLGEDQANFDQAVERAGKLKAEIDDLEHEYEQLEAAQKDALGRGEYSAATDSYLDNLKSDIEDLNRVYSGAQQEVKEFSKDLSDQQERASLAQKSLQQQREVIEDLKKTVSDLEKTREVKLFKNPGDEIEKEQRSLDELRSDLEQARAEEKRRQDAYDSAAAENNLAKEAQQYEKLGQEAEEARVKQLEANEAMTKDAGHILNPSTLKSMGMTLSATVTPAIMDMGRSMIDASTDIDSAYRNMRKTVDGTEEQFEGLRKHAMDFATTHVTSADQILEIEAIGGELGVATENLTAFAEAISNIDVATDLNTEEAADALGHLGNIMHLTADDYEGFSNALVRLGNNGASTESEIANIAERIGSMGSIVGMSASDVLAWSSSIASTGMNAEAAGTAVSKTMSFFETAVASAGGTIDTSFDAISRAVQNGGNELVVFSNLMGQSAEEFTAAWESDPEQVFNDITEQVDGARESLQGIADVAHMTSEDFISAWENDPTSVMEAFIKGLNDIEEAGGSADAVLQGFKITSVRQKQAIEGLMQTIGGLDDNLKMSEDAWNGISDKWGKSGDAANEAAKKAEGFSGQIQIMKNVWHNALAELGEGAAPIIKVISDGVSEMSKWFTSLDQSTKTAIVGIGGFVAALGPVLTVISTFGTAKQNVMNWAAESITGLAAVKTQYQELGAEAFTAMHGMTYETAAFKTVISSIGATIKKAFIFTAAIAAIGLLVSALKNLYDQYKDHEAATKGMRDAIAGIGEEAEVTAGKTDLTASTLRNLAKDSQGYESRLADLSRTIKESNDQYSTYAGTLTYYGDAVRDLAGKENRTQEESAKLSAALEGINDACGTTYALDEYGNIIDTQTGQIQENTDTILANVDARRAQALMEYYGDDYAKAVGQVADAQEKYNEAYDYYKKLTEDGGKEAYLAHVKEVYGATYDEQQALAAYNKEVSDARSSMTNYTNELNGAEEALGKLEGKMADAQSQYDAATEKIDAAKQAEEDYATRMATVTEDVTGNMKALSDAMDSVGGDDAGFNAIATGLEAISVHAEELNGVDMTALISGFDSANGSMAQVVQTLEDGGVVMSTWNSALEQAPGAAENMSNVTAAAFQSMYDSAGGDINATMTLIAGLDTVQVGDKTFYIGDNGSITDAQGKVYDLKKDMDSLPPQVTAKVKGDNKDAQSKVKESKSAVDAFGRLSASAKLKATDYASSAISSVKSSLRDLDGRSATTTINVITRRHTITTSSGGGHQATGGMNSVPVIPRHASGYIATGPTLTNQGWIGEDGIEAVANWATGGAVVPLTNKRYMLPIADAIADGMAKRMGDVTNAPQVSIVVNGVSSPDEVARAITNALSLTL